MADHITVAVEAAREAGALLLRSYGTDLVVEAKKDSSLVTDIDRRSERIVVERLRASFPGYRILAEEGSVGASSGEYCWIIDPLDGTHNFIRGLGNFGVSIGLARGDELVAGVICMPLENRLYRAEKGSGAYGDDRRIEVSRTDAVERCSLCFDSSIRYDPDRITATLRRAGTRVFNLRMFGSSVRTLTYLAEGKVDAALEFDDRPWDFAAGMVLLQEAGGQVHALDGGPLSLEKCGYIASNGLIHKELQAILSDSFEAAP